MPEFAESTIQMFKTPDSEEFRGEIALSADIQDEIDNRQVVGLGYLRVKSEPETVKLQAKRMVALEAQRIFGVPAGSIHQVGAGQTGKSIVIEDCYTIHDDPQGYNS